MTFYVCHLSSDENLIFLFYSYSKQHEFSQKLTRVPLDEPVRFSGSFSSRPGGQLVLRAGDDRRTPMRVTPEGKNIYRNYILHNYNSWCVIFILY